MSLGGIAIAVGAMVDAAIVVVEQTHKKLENAGANWTAADYRNAIVAAVKEVGGPSFFALLVIAVSFLPVLTLEAQEGRLFKPLAYTKNFCHDRSGGAGHHARPGPAAALLPQGEVSTSGRAGLARIVNAVLVGTIHSEEKHPISRILMRLYEPVVAWSLRWKWAVIFGAVALVALTVAGVSAAGLRVHAAAGRRRAALHAIHAPRHLGRRSAKAHANARPHSHELPGSGPRARQIRPRRNLHRPGAPLDDGDHRRAQAEIAVAQGANLVSTSGRSGSNVFADASRPIVSPPTRWWMR